MTALESERYGGHFDEAELAQLLWAIAAINAWNRIGVATRLQPEP